MASRDAGMVSMPGSTCAIIASSRSRSLRAAGRTMVVVIGDAKAGSGLVGTALTLRFELRQCLLSEKFDAFPQFLRFYASAAGRLHVETVANEPAVATALGALIPVL